jgi:hypothetical protein
MTNSNGKLSVPLADASLSVPSSGKVEVFHPTVYDEDDFGEVVVKDESNLPKSVSVSADLTDVDLLKFRIEAEDLKVSIKFDGDELATMDDAYGYNTVEISGLEDYGTNTTVTIEVVQWLDEYWAYLRVAYVRGINKPESGIFKLVDTGGEL